MLGASIGLLVWLPFRCWRHEHAVHHATAGDLDRRGIGDIPTLTVAEYRALPVVGRARVPLFRNPVVMFGLGWLLVLVLKPRLVPRGSRPRIRNSVLGTNLALAIIVAGLCLTARLAQLPPLAGPGLPRYRRGRDLAVLRPAPVRGHLLARARRVALRPTPRSQGSSYLKLPRLLQFFTGNIGFHHVHHLSVGIPNYNLQARARETDGLRAVPELTLRDGLRATRLKLWDERDRRLVTFREARMWR